MKAEIATIGEIRNIISTKNVVRKDEEVDKDMNFLFLKWKLLRYIIGCYKNVWSNSQITITIEATERFKPRIWRYGQWIWYEWVITICVLNLLYKHPYFLVIIL